jgi:cell division protein FtsI (penicillin-binding protein 3)
LNLKNLNQEKNYSEYYTKNQDKKNVIPNLKGMSGMDAVALLGNLKVKVKVIGVGKVKKQSINPGEAIKSDTIITLELS